MNTTPPMRRISPASGVLTLRAQQKTNQLLRHLVEQLLADAKRQRDAEAQHVNSRLVLAEEGETFCRQVFGGVARQLAAGGPAPRLLSRACSS